MNDNQSQELTAVGLDIGTGFTKVSGNGNRAIFPSLYSCEYSTTISTVTDMEKRLNPEDGTQKKQDSTQKKLREHVGSKAIIAGNTKNGILVRPIKFGMPYNARGFERLVTEALRCIGIKDPAKTVMVVGITFDAGKQRNMVMNVINSKFKPFKCLVIPQVFGTLAFTKRTKENCVIINIGHGTTEIARIKSGRLECVTIPKATEFVTSQLSSSSSSSYLERQSYTDYERLFADNQGMAKRLGELLATHICDSVGRMNIEEDDQVLIAGGGSQIPGITEAITRILGKEVAVVDEPVMSNVIGLEQKGIEYIQNISGNISGNTTQETAGESKVEALPVPPTTSPSNDQRSESNHV